MLAAKLFQPIYCLPVTATQVISPWSAAAMLLPAIALFNPDNYAAVQHPDKACPNAFSLPYIRWQRRPIVVSRAAAMTMSKKQQQICHEARTGTDTLMIVTAEAVKEVLLKPCTSI